MSDFFAGQRFTATVTLTDPATGLVVDPGTFRFDLKPPTGAGVSDANYVYNGSWTNSESTIGEPSKVSAGVYRLEVTLPSANTAAGDWRIWWLTTENGSGGGVDSGSKTVRVKPR